MFKSIIFFLSLGMFCIENLSASALSSNNIPEMLNYFLNCFQQNIERKNKDLVLVSKNIECGDCGIKTIALLFDYFQTVDIPQARRLVNDLIKELALKINSEEKLKKFFDVYPVDTDQFDIRIRIRSPTSCFVYPVLGNIAYISVLENKIYYSTLNSYTFELDNLRTEPLVIQ